MTGSDGRRSGPRAWLRRLLVPTPGSEALVESSPPVPVREIFRRFWPYARPYRRWLAVGVLLIALVPAIDTVTIWMFKLVVDDVLVPRDFSPFVWIALAYIGLTLASGVISFFDEYLATWVGERFLLGMRTSFFRHLQSLSLDFFERRRLGDVISRLTGDIAAIESFVLSGVTDALSYLLRIAFFSAALFYLQWDLALVALLAAPLFWLAARHFSRLIKLASREKRRRSGSISAVAEESLSNAALVQAYNRQDAEVERFHAENLGSYEATMASTRLKALYTPLVDMIELSGVLVVIGLGTWELSRGGLTIGGLLVFLAFLSQLYSPVRGLGRLTNTIYAASAATERIIEFLDLEPAVKDRPGAVALGRVRGAVEFEDVRFRYPETDCDALSGLALKVEPGEMLALVGPSGAGKSTLTKLLLRFYDPAAGRVTIDGHDLREVRLHSLRENIALLLQETLVFDGTIAENIGYGSPSATRQDVVRAARLADAHRFIEALPDGYETSIGQKGRRLSGGQRQRIAIARALVRDAPILVLDEPTTGVDADTAKRLIGPMRRLVDGRTTIVISHNLMLAREADAIAVVENGCIVEHGTHDQLMEAAGLYRRLYRLNQPEEVALEPVGRIRPAVAA